MYFRTYYPSIVSNYYTYDLAIKSITIGTVKPKKMTKYLIMTVYARKIDLVSL